MQLEKNCSESEGVDGRKKGKVFPLLLRKVLWLHELPSDTSPCDWDVSF
jgi:hypothetical protein